MPLVEAARYSSRVQADLARLLLESRDIEAVLFDAEMSSYGLGPIFPARLMVLDEDLDEALSILAESRLT